MLVENSNTQEAERAELTEPGTAASPLRLAYDRIISGIEAGRQQMVFDEFWREGELALMFGAPGAGKTTFALRLANALASEGDIPWFRMDSAAGKTLYVDLAMSDRQFASRYGGKRRSGQGSAKEVSKRLYCDRPPDESELVEWLEDRIESEGIKYVIIDDLSAVMRTCDGTRETLAMMRGLRKIRDRFDVSILVVMQSAEPRQGEAAAERDLGRQRALCRIPDSVFAIARHPRNNEKIYLSQTRSRNGGIVWTPHNAPVGTLEEKNGQLTLRFEMNISEADRKLIMSVVRLRDQKMTFRAIGTRLGISKSRAARLDKRWSVLIEEEGRIAREEEEDEWDEDDDESFDMDEGSAADGSQVPAAVEPPRRVELRGPIHGPWPCPFLYDKSNGAKRWLKFLFSRHPDRTASEIRSAYKAGDKWCRPPGSVPPIDPEDPFAGMEVDVDALGNVKYVVERDVHGKPIVYYAYRPDGRLRRFEWERMTLANPNLFGRFADIGKDGNPYAVVRALT